MNTDNLSEFEKHMIAEMDYLKRMNQTMAKELHNQREEHTKLQTKLDDTNKFVKEKLNDRTLIDNIRQAVNHGENSVNWDGVIDAQARLFTQIIEREEDLEKQIEKGFLDTRSAVVSYGKQWQ